MAADRAERRRISPRALIILVAVALVVYGIDQLAKYLVVTNLEPGRLVSVLGPFLQFQLTRNSGAAFSIGSGSTWLFSIIGAAVLVFVVWYAPRIRSRAWAVLFGLLLGGLLGNLTDRLFRDPGFGEGRVVDFLRIPLLPAIFNLADTAIVSSMALFLILTISGIGLDGRRHADDASEVAPPGPAAGGSEATGAPAAEAGSTGVSNGGAGSADGAPPSGTGTEGDGSSSAGGTGSAGVADGARSADGPADGKDGDATRPGRDAA